MAKIVVCTGKKKSVGEVLGFYIKLEKEKKIKILAKKVQTKKALIWSYDELRILLTTVPGFKGDIAISKEMRKGLDLFTVKDQAMVVVDFETFKVEDTMLKAKILTIARSFVSRNVHVKVNEQIHKHSEYRIERRCVGKIHGPVDGVFAYKDLLEREKLLDPKSLSYTF